MSEVTQKHVFLISFSEQTVGSSKPNVYSYLMVLRMFYYLFIYLAFVRI